MCPAALPTKELTLLTSAANRLIGEVAQSPYGLST